MSEPDQNAMPEKHWQVKIENFKPKEELHCSCVASKLFSPTKAAGAPGGATNSFEGWKSSENEQNKGMLGDFRTV